MATMRTAAAWAALIAIGSTAALADTMPQPQRQAFHNIPWYMAHATERRTLLRLCESDTAFDRNPDCNNAVMARLRSNTLAQAKGIWGVTVDPLYWAEHGVGLDGIVEGCESGQPSLLKPNECDAAAIGLGMQKRRTLGR